MQDRLLRVLAAAAIAVGFAGASGVTSPVADAARTAADDCPTGWTEASEPSSFSIYDTLSVGGRAVSVGTQRLLREDRTYMTAWWKDGQWETERGPSMGGDAGLVSVGGSRLDRVWAVGFVDDGRARGIAARWESGRWVRHDPPRPASGGMVLSGVDVDPLGRVWAVGQTVSESVVRTGLVMERRSGVWTRRAVPVRPGTGFTGVRALAPDDVWVIGSRLSGRGLRPIVAHWNGDRWSVETITSAGSNALLAGIAGTAKDDLWAVGWTTSDTGETRPLVLHRTAGGWTVVEPPALGGLFSVLADVSIDDAGRPWVVGGAYRDTVDLYVPVAARLGETGWTAWPRPPGTGRYLDAVSGDPVTGGWMTGRSDAGALRLRACEPVAPARAGGRLAGQGDARPVDDLAGHESGPAPRRGLRQVPRLAAAVSPADLQVRDAAVSAGIDQATRTYGATWADLDDDGRKDLFISGHSGPATLYLRKSDGFELQPSGLFRRIDRHDCDVARIDDDGLGDVICTGGADRGVGFKANEIWIDPVLGVPDDQGAARGIADPVGRGRSITVFDVEGDGDPDIVFGTAPMRWDSQPSPVRLMLNDGTGHFTWDPGSGIPGDKGAWCLVPADVDADGDKDLLQCAVAGNVVPSARLVVLRNDGGRFRQVQKAWGVRSIGERDAKVGNLGGDSHPDLVQLSTTRIRVSIWRDGRWVRSFERSIGAARAIAVGDVNGDGRDDIYLQLGSGFGNTPDVVLLNNGSGTGFTTLAVPSTSRGLAEDVISLDWNSDGLDDFLVLNGNKRPGPVQLITFSR